MKKRDAVSIGDIYGSMLNSVKRTLKESHKPKTFEGEFKSKLKDGPENASGYNQPLNDDEPCHCDEEEDEEDKDDVSKYLPSKRQKTTEKLKDKLDDPKLNDKTREEIKSQLNLRQSEEAEEEDDDRDDDYSEESWENKFRKEKGHKWDSKDIEDTISKERNKKYSDEDEEQIQESKKIATKILNNHMSKSVFDKLYNKVLKENFGQEQEGDDIDALGLDGATPDSEMDDDFGDDEDFGGEEDSVTFTLDRATAEKLLDVIGAAMGMEHDESEGENEFGGDDEDLDFESEDDDFDGEEDEEVQGTKVAPDKKGVFQAKSNKVGGKANPKGSHSAKTDVTDEVGTKTSAPSIAALQGKNNQVPGSTIKKGQDYFR
jgi:hypothetical protein